jgi:hypothetical protein
MVTELAGRHPQDALDRAAPNETIVDGTGERREIAEPVTVTTPGVTLAGLHLRLADGADENLVEVAADGVTVTDFVLDGNRANQPGDRQSNGLVVAGGSNVAVANGLVRNPSRHGIRVADTATITSDSTVEGDTVSVAAADRASDVTVRDVRVESPRRDGCSVEGPAVSNVAVRNVRTFDSSDRGGVEIKDGASDAVVANCYAEGCRYGCAIQDHGEYGVANVVFTGNTAVECDTAIDAQTSLRHAAVAVVGNTARGVTGAGMGGPGGIHMGRVDGLVVANNLLEGTGETGIRVEDCADAQVTGNVVRGTTTGPSIDVADAPGALINDNVAVDAGGDGVRCAAGGDAEVTDVQVCNNRCTGNDGFGIRFVEEAGTIDYVLVSTNVVRGNERRGIEVEASGTNIIVSDNLR